MTALFDPITQTPAAGAQVGVAPAAGTTPRAWIIDMLAPAAWLNANTRTDRRRPPPALTPPPAPTVTTVQPTGGVL